MAVNRDCKTIGSSPKPSPSWFVGLFGGVLGVEGQDLHKGSGAYVK